MQLESSDAERPAKRRLILWAALCLGAVGVVAIIVYRSITFISQPPPRRGRFQDGGNQPVGVATIKRGDIRLTLRALGAVTPLATVTVTTQINGLLMNVGFKEGQLVHKGKFWRRSIRGRTRWRSSRTRRSWSATRPS